jgi:UDP-N-acetylmuramoyl-tripeptide--D-alanyl-D-alanine ligase
MKELAVAELARIVRAEPGKREGTVTGVSVDSRTTKEGDCFFAIRGENFDGHDYAPAAFSRGATCAVVERDIEERSRGTKPMLKISDTVQALGDLAREYRKQSHFKVVAITGSVGKTTTRQIVYHVLSRHYRVSQSPKNFNNNIGLPLALLGADPKDQVVVAELGSNHPGEIACLTRIAHPDIAVVTNVYPAHLKGFGSLQTIVQEKLSIADGLVDGGVLVINGDLNVLVGACRTRATEFTTFGKSPDCDFQVRDITHDGFSSSFTIDGEQIHLPVPGLGNVENAAAAWAVCSQFDTTIHEFAQAVATLPAVAMRAEPLQIGTLTVLNDCYNANPASMKNALDMLRNLRNALDPNRNRRTVFICGDMAELGRQAEQLHAELGDLVAQAEVQVLLAVGEFAEVTTAAAKGAATYDLQAVCFEDTSSACSRLHEFVEDYDIILVKGSRTGKLETAVEKLKELFTGVGTRHTIRELRRGAPQVSHESQASRSKYQD